MSVTDYSSGDVATDSAITAALAAATPAGENHIGEVGGRTLMPASSVTFSVGGAAATGDYVGTSTSPQAFANAVRVTGGTGVLKAITITDELTTAAVDMELWLFSETVTVPTDNAAWAITDAHRLKCVGVVPLPASKWYADANGKVFSSDELSLPIKCAATSLFYALVARGTTPAWATGNVQITLHILSD